MPFDQLLQLIEEPVETVLAGESGRRYRAKTYAFWDMDPHESELYTRVQVSGRGLYRYQRYYGVHIRMPDGESAEEPIDAGGVSSAWTENLAWTGLAIVVIALIAPWFVGVAYLLSTVL